MKKDIFKTTYLYGIIPNIKKKFNDFYLYNNDNSLPSVFLTKIKVWFGKTKEQTENCLLGIKCWYINYRTNEKKESEYHGCNLEGNNIDSKELEINNNDYFNKINFGFDSHITHFKISTKKGRYIEFGELVDDFEKILRINMEDNMIVFFSGYFSSLGIRAIRIKYINRKDYIFYNIFDILRLRNILKKNENIKNFYQDEINNNKLNIEMKTIFRTCLFPDTIFSTIIKYL